MSALLDVILPVFLVIGFGYAAARGGLFDGRGVDGLMRFAQTFAVPCLLFRSIAHARPWRGLSTRADAVASTSGPSPALRPASSARSCSSRRPVTDAVAIGFVCLFSNSLLLGLPITERAYGPDALAGQLCDHLDPRAAVLRLRHHADGMVAPPRHGPVGRARWRGRSLRAIFSQPLVHRHHCWALS